MLRRILCFFWVSLCNGFFFTVRSLSRVHADDASPKANEKSCTFFGPDEKQNHQQLHNSMSDHFCESRIELLSEAVSSKCRLSFGTDDISRFVQELCRVMTLSFIVEKVFLGCSSSTISTLWKVKSDEGLAEIEEEEAFETGEEKDELFHDVVEDSSFSDDFDLNSVLRVGSFNGEVVLGDAGENKLGLLSEAVIYEEKTCDDEGDVEETIWEHDDIIEQLKFELKLTRTGGLPTIIEEEETELESISSPGTALASDPKPMNCTIQAEQKIEQILEQIQKVHRMYGDKMRELDALNYRTMHAIGLVQMKDHPTSTKKSGNIHHLLLPWLRRKKKVWPEVMISMESMIYEDLELVSVGQMCLSWEILHWQYRKARQLLQLHHSTTHDQPQYYYYNNHVANYAKKPCIFGRILQVPAITSDNDGFIGKERENGASIIELVANLEESIHDLWCFIRSDKAATETITNNQKNTPSSIQQQGSAADSTLFMAIRTHLLKKKRRLKDIVRSSNCIVKKKKQQQQMHLIIAQIQLKLISRVLRMRKLTTCRLLWCRHKLDQTSIDYVDDQEPSFLLFPC